MTQLIIRAAESVTHQNNTFFIFPCCTNSPSPTDLASFSAAGISPGSFARQWCTITQSKKPCGTDKCSFYRAGETLCSHIRDKYLLFISAKAGGATMEKVELIAKEGGGAEGIARGSMTTKLEEWGAVYFNIQIQKSANQIFPSEKVQQDEL